nr:PREDICTED: ankyrin repeat domain-containing protein 26-like [Lepisosteus oculatus]
MKKIFSFAKKKKGFSPNSSDTGSVLSAGYELKEKDLGKLHKAASTGDLTKLKQLVKKHDFNQLDKENRTPLHLACAYGHADIVRFLAEGKAKLNLCDNQNRSPLMKAVQCQQEQCAVTLLENDADPNLVDINGNTALHLSALIPSISMAAQLLEHKANINAENKEGCTPLILAVTENHPEMVEFLLKEGADVDADNNSKRTSLMIAASNGQISMVRLLLRYNADISLKDDKGWTADDHSVMNGHHAMDLELQQSTEQLSGAGEGKVEEDTSQTASISRASNKGGAGDSWPSTDEDEELDFSPKKQQKPNLKKLLNASQKGRKNVKTDSPDWRSEGESENENKDGTERNSCPPSTLPLTSSTLHLANPSPQSFSKPPQMTSTPLQGSSKEEEEEEEEEEEDKEEDEEGEEEHLEDAVASVCITAIAGDEEMHKQCNSRGDYVKSAEADVGNDANRIHSSVEVKEFLKERTEEIVGQVVTCQNNIPDEEKSNNPAENEDKDAILDNCETIEERMVSAHIDIEAAKTVSVILSRDGSEEENLDSEKLSVHRGIAESDSSAVSKSRKPFQPSKENGKSLDDSWDSEEGASMDEQVLPKDKLNAIKHPNDVPVSLIVGHYETAFDVTNDYDDKLKDRDSTIQDHLECIDDEKNIKEEEEGEIQNVNHRILNIPVKVNKAEVNFDKNQRSKSEVPNSGSAESDDHQKTGVNMNKSVILENKNLSENEEDSWDSDQAQQKGNNNKSTVSHSSRDESGQKMDKHIGKHSDEDLDSEPIAWDDVEHLKGVKDTAFQRVKNVNDSDSEQGCKAGGTNLVHSADLDMDRQSECSVDCVEEHSSHHQDAGSACLMVTYLEKEPKQMLEEDMKEDYSTDEDEDGEEGEEEADAEVLENLPSLKKGSGSVGDMMLPESKATSKYVKRDLLSELGLEPAEEEDSPWDSESASESPRKFQNGSTNSAVKAQTVMHSISEETNEELFYIPSFLRGSRNYRMAKLEDSRSIGRPGGPRGLGAEEINLEKKALKTLPLSASSSPAMHVEKTDLMKELGLGDVDDLEGTSLSAPLPSPRSLPSRSTPQPQPRTRKMLQVKGRGEEESDWDSESDASVSSPEKSGKHQPTAAEEKASSEQNTARSKDTLLSPEEEQSESSSEPEGGLNEDKVLPDTTELELSNPCHIGPMESDVQVIQEEDQESGDRLCSAEDSSEVPWEARYEQIWVETEKREVKSHYKNVAAELKEKFGEIALKQSGESTHTASKSGDDKAEPKDISEEESSDEEIVHLVPKAQSAVLQPIPEQRESGLDDSVTEPEEKQQAQLKGRTQPYEPSNSNGNRIRNDSPSPENTEHNVDYDNIFKRENKTPSPEHKAENYIEGYDTDLDSDSGNSGGGNSDLNPDESRNSNEKAGRSHSMTPRASISEKSEKCTGVDIKHLELTEENHEPIHTSSQCAASKRPSDEELEEDMQRFKNEVGMLKVVFLALEKEKAQLQKEVSREKKAFGGSQISAELEDLERPHRQTETEKYESSQKSKTQHDSEKRNSFKKEDQKPFKVTRAVRQKISSIRGPDLTSDQDEDDVDNERIPKLSKLEVITGARHSKPQQAFFVNGDPLSVFDDSTLSEMSEDGVRAPLAVTQKNKSNEEIELADDFDDFTQSSDTATEDVESPISGYRNASLLLKQLDCGSIDSVSLVKIQNMFHEYERTIQKERGRYNLLNDKVRQLEEERRELRKSLENTREGKSSLEHRQVELETDLNNLKFVLKQEREKQKNAVMLYEQSRDQLRKKEEQYCQELEGKQQVELTMRNLEMEMRALINNMKQLEEDRNEAQRLLTQERNARVLQEGILNNHLRKQKEIEEENKRTVTKSTEILSQLGEASDRKKDLLQQNRSLQDEVAMLKLDLDRAKAHNQQEEAKYSEENEALKEKVEDLKRDLKLNEEALAQTVFQYNSQLSALKTECSVITSKLEHEKQAKDKLETELESVRIRLTSALQEVERSQAAKADLERTLQRERDEWLRLQEKHNSEATSQRESINSLSQQLGKAEAKANSLENECHRATLSLTEKVLLLETMQREKEQAQSRQKELEASLQAEKDQMSKSLFRQETMQERLVQVQSENMLLRQQLEEAQNKGIIKEKVVTDVQDRFSDILTKLRADSEERVHMVEERSKELVAKNIELREQIYKHENEKSEREGVLRQTQQELADALKKLSMCEASLEVNTHYRNSLEEEKLTLQKEMDRMKTKLQDTEDQYIQAERRIHDLKNALDDKEREVISSSQKLQQVLSTSSGAEKTIKQLEEHMQQLEIENAKLEAASKQQTNRIEVLQKENQEAAVIRNRLEDFVTNLQGSKINLEEQLNREVQKQSMLSHNAQDSHLLWEEELKSRSKLGLRLAELEREKGDLTSQVETEKKKARKVAEMKRSAETRLDQEMKRNSELQKEMNRLRTLVKTAKKKLKDQENGEFASHHSSFRGEMDHKALETETAVARFRNKVDDLSQHLEKEELKSARLETMNSDLREQLASLKALTQGHEKLERNKRQLEEEVAKLRKHVETSMLDQSQIEQYRREAEERARQEIRQKLEEVNLFLQTQAASQEALEQIKATNEATLRNQLEQRIRDLECELSRVRSSQQDHMSQRDSTQTELERYKELYTDELRLRKSLAAKLERSNERLAEANTKLLGERQRSKSLIASSIVNGSLTAGPVLDMNQLQGSLGPFGGTLGPLNRNLSLGGSFLNPVGDGLSQNSRVEAYLAKMQNELEKNISKELDHATAELEGGSARLSPVGSAAGSLKSVNLDQDPVSRATQQYLEVLKKNYMI